MIGPILVLGYQIDQIQGLRSWKFSYWWTGWPWQSALVCICRPFIVTWTDNNCATTIDLMETWTFSWATNYKSKKRTGHTRDLWKVITRISDLDALGIERIHIQSLAVNITNWTIVTDYHILRVVYFFNIATILRVSNTTSSSNEDNILVNGRGWQQRSRPKAIRAIDHSIWQREDGTQSEFITPNKYKSFVILSDADAILLRVGRRCRIISFSTLATS